jgi:hypothetical protein
MKTINTSVDGVCYVGVEHIHKKDSFSADMERLDKLGLSEAQADNPQAQKHLSDLKKLGHGYVNAVMHFIADRSFANAKNLHRITNAVREEITSAQSDFPQEPAFARTSQRPIAKTAEAISKSGIEHVGNIFNSIFATFAGSTFFPDYLKHYAKLERNHAAKQLEAF